jgi:hypothetical protein
MGEMKGPGSAFGSIGGMFDLVECLNQELAPVLTEAGHDSFLVSFVCFSQLTH